MMRTAMSLFFLLAFQISMAAEVPPAARAKNTPSATSWIVASDEKNGSVQFDALGRPSALKITGKGSSPKGNLEIQSGLVKGALTFELETLDTGIKLRDEHMKKKYLETEKFPKTTLTFENWKLPEALLKDDADVESVPFEGKLMLHGIEKKISGTTKVRRKAGKLEATAQFAVKTGEFGIATPSFAGITMAEDVNVKVLFNAAMATSPASAKP